MSRTESEKQVDYLLDLLKRHNCSSGMIAEQLKMLIIDDLESQRECIICLLEQLSEVDFYCEEVAGKLMGLIVVRELEEIWEGEDLMLEQIERCA